MNISIEAKEPLVDWLIVTVEPADYQADYESQLKNYRKRIALPGFRQGMVPASLVRKRFGSSILAEQLNQMVGKGLSRHIQDQGIRFVGRPYLVGDTFAELDPEGQRPYAFTFELGREPEFELNVSNLPEVGDYTVTVTDADLDRQIVRARYQHGPSEPAEKVEGDAKTAFNLVGILRVEGEPEEGSTLPFPRFFGLHTVLVPTLASEVYGKKPGDTVHFVPAQAFTSPADGAAQLRLEPAEYTHVAQRTLTLEIKQVFLNRPHELDAKFFELVAGPGIADEKAFREALRAKLEGQARQMADYLQQDRIKRVLLEAHPFELPDRILQRWLADEYEEFRKEGELERRYAAYRDELRLHLIQRKLAERYPELQLGEDDVRREVSARLVDYFSQQGGGHVHTHDHDHDHDHDHGHHHHGHDHDHAHDHAHDHDDAPHAAAPHSHVHDAAELTEGHHHGHDHSHDHAHADDHIDGDAPAHDPNTANPVLQAGLVEQLVDRFLQDEQFVTRETTALRNRRFFEVMTSQVVKLAPRAVSYTDFERIVATGGAEA